MKLDRLETHDRLKHLKSDQSLNISKGAEDCLKTNKLSLALQEKCDYVYLFAHPRTSEDGVTKIMYWQPRLTKPLAQTNSYLFRAQSKSDLVEICWLLPPSEMWSQYEKGKVTQNDMVMWSIDQFMNNKQNLEKREPDDLEDGLVRHIYRQIHEEMNTDKTLDSFMNRMIGGLGV